MVKNSSLTAGFLREHGIYANFVFLGDDNNPLDFTVYLDTKPVFSVTCSGKTRWSVEAFPLVPEVLKGLERQYRVKNPSELRKILWTQLQTFSRKKIFKDSAYIEWEEAFLQDLCKVFLKRNPAFSKDLLGALVTTAQSQFGEADVSIKTPSGMKTVSRLCGYSTIETQETDCLIWNRGAASRTPTELIRSILIRDEEKCEILAVFSKTPNQKTLPYQQALDCLTSRYGDLIDPMVFYTALADKQLLDENCGHSAEAKRYLKALILLMRHREELHQKELSKKVLVPRF